MKIKLLIVLSLIGLFVKGQSNQREVVSIIEIPSVDLTTYHLTISKEKPIRYVSGKAFTCISFVIQLVDYGVCYDSIQERLSNSICYVDGVRIIGDLNIPIVSIDQIQVIRGGTPVEFGGF